MVTVRPLSGYPLAGITIQNYDVPEEVSVNPVTALLFPLILIIPVAKAEIVITVPVIVFN